MNQTLEKDFTLHQELVKLYDEHGHHKTLFDLQKTPYCSCGKRPKKLYLYWSKPITGISMMKQATMPHPPRPQPIQETYPNEITPTNNPLFLRWIAKCEPCNWKTKSSRNEDQINRELEIHRIKHHPPTK